MSDGYRHSLLSRAAALRFGKELLLSLAVLGTLFEVGAAAYPAGFAGWERLGELAVLVIVVAAYRASPRKDFSVSFTHPATTIRVKVGDLLAEAGHLVIGFSDTFDTELGEVISAESLQGQFLSKTYRGDRERLDRELAAALRPHEGQVDTTKTKGKNRRYPLGTTVSLSGEGRRFVCCAYTRLRSDNYVAESDIDVIWNSLGAVWKELRTRGEQGPVAIPIVGSFLARVGGGSCAVLVRLILLSYFVHSRITPISQQLTLVIAEPDLTKVNLVEIEDFVRTLNC